MSAEDIYNLIRGVKDPDNHCTLEELRIITPDDIFATCADPLTFAVYYQPTGFTCCCAPTIGLSIRYVLRDFPAKVDIYVREGTHADEVPVNRQLNDKERCSAAFDNINVVRELEKCVN